MNSIKQKKRLHSQTVEDSTAIATTKTQSKKLKQNNENVAVKPVESNTKKQKVGDEASEAKQSTVSQRKRMKTKERKLAAIAKVKEAGGVPIPLWPGKSGKSKLAKTNAQDSKTTDAVEKSPPAVSTSKGVRQVEEKLKKQEEKRLEKKILRKEKRQQEGQYKLENITLTIDQMTERINAIQSRGNLTKTAKRKLGILKKKLAIADGTYVPKPPIEKNDSDQLSKSQKRKLKRKNGNSTANIDVESNVEKPVDIQAFKKKVKKNQPQEEQMKPVKKSGQVKSTNKLDSKSHEQNKGAVTQVKLNGKKKEAKDKGAAKNKKIVQESKEDSDDEEEDEEESDSEDGQENKTTVLNSKAKKPKLSSTHDIKSNDEDDDDEEEDDEDEAESDENEEEEDVDDEEKEDEDDEEEEDEDDEEEENEDDAEDASDVEGEVKTQKKGDAKSQKKTLKGLTENGTTVKKQSPQNQDQEKKKRYVLFVGNIPFDTKSDDLKNHFLTKVSEVISVRIPTKTGTQVPRGFAYVEVTNDIDYEKGLSLHHSFINGRRINVEYTLSGSKQVGQRKDLISKNKKLDALRKAGKLAGGQKHDQKRSVRRFKQRNQDRPPF